MAANTGGFFGDNFLKGWKKSFDIKGRTNYADYSSFLVLNFSVIILIFLASYFLFPQVFVFLIIYLIGNIFPMTSLAIRRLNDGGSHPKYLLAIFGLFGGWWKLRERLATPSSGEKDPMQGMGKVEKIISDTFLWGAPEIAGVVICAFMSLSFTALYFLSIIMD